MTAEERATARNKFVQAPQTFSGAIGSINCTHINILAPRVQEEGYVNHHGNHSLNIQAVIIIYINIIMPLYFMYIFYTLYTTRACIH